MTSSLALNRNTRRFAWAALCVAVVGRPLNAPADTQASLPSTLVQTGLCADPACARIADDALPFSPQYPLWSDGADKRRWFSLPPGTKIDARHADAWRFPIGTKFWKEFRVSGRRIETRYITRAKIGWQFGAYVWNSDGTQARLVSQQGTTAHVNDHVRHAVPSVDDCRACHEGHEPPVLGFSLLQLSTDRDPLAPHAEPRRESDVDVAQLRVRGLIKGLSLDADAIRIAASTPTERAALGYLHANCGGCHNSTGPLSSLELFLMSSSRASSTQQTRNSLFGVTSHFQPAGQSHMSRATPGRPELSTLVARMRSRDPFAQMPPLATQLVDREGLALIEHWIATDPAGITTTNKGK
ncbi:MAG: hypothetical protein SF187_21925 [Deltaproteobacteria bacterium]|nr:hypothetical protein [Deltaproteobacteria bacterium]